MSENVVFREKGVFGKMPILHSSAVLGRTPPTKYSQGFLDFSRGGQKTGKNQCFLVVSCAVFCFLYRLLMVTCRLDKPSCLQMCHSSLLSYFSCYVFLLSGGCVSLFLFIFIFSWAHYFSFGCLSFLSSLLVGQKPRWNHKISPNFDCHLLLRCQHPHTFTWPR